MRSVILALVLLASCVTPRWILQDEFENKLQARVGQEIGSTISALGQPTQISDLPNGKKLYEWLRYYGSEASRNTAAIPFWATASATHSERWCAIRYTVDGSRIVEGHWESPSCF